MHCLLSQQQVEQGVRRLAEQISATYDSQPLTIVGVMTGSVVLLADLIRQLEMPLRVGVVLARSYRGTATTPGPLTVYSELVPDIVGRHLLLVDDIFDTGRTLRELVERSQQMQPLSVRTAVLLRKSGKHEVALEPDFVGFDIPDKFVVGYGLDYQDAYRNLPYVAALDECELGAALG